MSHREAPNRNRSPDVTASVSPMWSRLAAFMICAAHPARCANHPCRQRPGPHSPRFHDPPWRCSPRHKASRGYCDRKVAATLRCAPQCGCLLALRRRPYDVHQGNAVVYRQYLKPCDAWTIGNGGQDSGNNSGRRWFCRPMGTWERAQALLKDGHPHLVGESVERLARR